MSEDLRKRLDMLERAVLEMGAEVYSLRGVAAKSREYKDHVMSVMGGLKHLLDDKGLISIEDFEAAVDLVRSADRSSQEESALEDDLGKKTSH